MAYLNTLATRSSLGSKIQSILHVTVSVGSVFCVKMVITVDKGERDSNTRSTAEAKEAGWQMFLVAFVL